MRKRESNIKRKRERKEKQTFYLNTRKNDKEIYW